MKHVYEGKTKSVYQLDDGNYLLKFKDDVTGENGVFDPGSNSIGLSIEGVGMGGLRLTEYFFKKIADAGIPTHFISADIKNATMTVRPATVFGKGLEVVCRLKAAGSFIKRYGDYVTHGTPLNYFVEVTLKDDERQDPPITKDALEVLNLLTADEYEQLKSMTKRIAAIVEAGLAEKGLELYDIKFEFGRVDGQVALIDEISGGNMRAFKGGEWVQPLDLVSIVLD